MIRKIGIRREDKSPWERRVPLIPSDVAKICEQGVKVAIQPSSIRCYQDEEFTKAGAQIAEDLEGCEFFLGVKEMPISFLRDELAHLFFSHTIKGQSYNMPLLQSIIDKKATLLDYERVVNEQNQRLIAFGRFAGLAGMIDSLSILGRRLKEAEHVSSLSQIRFAHEYEDLAAAKEHLRSLAPSFAEEKNVPSQCVCITGDGNVARGAKEIIELLGWPCISGSEVLTTDEHYSYTMMPMNDFMRVRGNSEEFSLTDYIQNPDKYESFFVDYLPHLSAVVNCIYWDEKYPRIVTKDALKQLQNQEQKRSLEVIGDISCDIGGSVACTYKATTPETPAYVYQPVTDQYQDGWLGEGIAVLAVDILPAEFPRDASGFFSEQLMKLLPELIQLDFSEDFDEAGWQGSLKRSVIVWRGELTPEYKYLEEYL